MAKKLNPVNVVMWLVGVLVALAVGFGMTAEVLVIPVIPALVTIAAGWIIIVMTIIGVIMTLIKQFG